MVFSILNSTTVPPITVNSYPPLWQNLILAGIGFIPLFIMFWLFFRTDFIHDLVEKMYEGIGKPKYVSSYSCNCARCQFELRTKKGLKRWKREHRFKKEDMI